MIAPLLRLAADRLDPPARLVESGASLLAFVTRMSPGYRPARHHRHLAAALERVERGEIDRLLVVMPPRHGKSELCSVHFPAWFLGRNPDLRVIACSHTAALAQRFSRLVRGKVTDPRWPFPARLAAGEATVQAWGLAGHAGGYVAAGVGGPITGMGADLLIIDDPVKSAEEALSAAVRDRTWEWYTGTAYPRLETGGRIVVIGTRWHPDDLIGRILASPEREQWHLIHFPALATGPDPLGRAPGDPLWPERFDARALERIKQAMGSFWFAAQYQGEPVAPSGQIFRPDAWPRYQGDPAALYRTGGPWQFLDTAYKAGAGHSRSAIVTWVATERGWAVVDCWTGQPDFPVLVEIVREQAAKWRPLAVVIEDQASGQSLLQTLRATTRLPVVPWRPGDRDKVARAHAVSAYIEAGRVALPAAAPWVEDFVLEHAHFPAGRHDDLVDTTTMALLYLTAGAWEAISGDLARDLAEVGLG